MRDEIKGLLRALFAQCFFVAFIFLFIACSRSSSVEEVSGSTVVAVINGKDITVNELHGKIRFLIKQFRISNKNKLTREEKLILKMEALNRIIRNNLLIMEATSKRVFLTQEEYEEALNAVKSGYHKDSLVQFMEVEGIPPELWEKSFKTNLLINKLINIMFKKKKSGNDKQARKYYDIHMEKFKKGLQVHAFHIMVASEAEAKDIIKKIRSNKRDFSDLAKIYSLSPEGPFGGDLGYFEVGQMPEEFDVVINLKNNQVSDIIKTPYGFHIFKVVGKKAARQMSFDESKKIIYNQMLRDEQSSAFEEWLIERKDNSNITINQDVLSEINL